MSSSANTFSVPFNASGVVFELNASTGNIAYQSSLQTMLYADGASAFNENNNKQATLIDAAYTPDYENHSDGSSTSGFELGQLLVPRLNYAIEANNELVIRTDSNTAVYSAITGTLRYVVCKISGLSALATCYDLGSDTVLSAADVNISFPDGVFKFTPTVEVV